jgi:mannobiose 2-epimerase
MVEIFLDKIVDNKTYHLICFMDRQWNKTSEIDSYGHDIEASWLIYEAAGLLKDKELLERVKTTCIKIADAAAEGIQTDGSMIDEKDNSTGKLITYRSWWPQAETVVGYLNAYELTGNLKYLNYSVNNWNYTKNHFVDFRKGGWYTSVNEDGTIGKGDKGGFWVCPYHNSRMCLEAVERVSKLTR